MPRIVMCCRAPGASMCAFRGIRNPHHRRLNLSTFHEHPADPVFHGLCESELLPWNFWKIQRASRPKFQDLNTALITSQSQFGIYLKGIHRSMMGFNFPSFLIISMNALADSRSSTSLFLTPQAKYSSVSKAGKGNNSPSFSAAR